MAEAEVDSGLTEEDKEFIRKKLAEPKIFVNGRRRFKDEVRARKLGACCKRSNFFSHNLVAQPLPEPEPEDEPSTVMDELNLAFLDALCDDDLERMEYFYALGADVNHRNIGANETPLHFAVCREDTKFAKWLIAKGADVNAEACHKMTPLHWAARLGQVEMVQVLVEAGCTLHPKSDRGIIPYWYTNKEQYDCKVLFVSFVSVHPLFDAAAGWFGLLAPFRSVLNFCVSAGAGRSAQGHSGAAAGRAADADHHGTRPDCVWTGRSRQAGAREARARGQGEEQDTHG